MNVAKYKYWIGGALCLLIIVVIIVAMRPKAVSGASSAAPLEVQVVQTEQKDVPIYGEWIGTLDGLVNADVRAQVTGYLLQQGYQEGAYVRKGQLLFQIDPRPFKAALDQTLGQLAQAKANLANAEAVQVKTQLDVDRYTPLAKEQAASQQDLDNAVQNNLAAKATIQTAKAQIQTYEASVETAKINLEFTRLSAPIDGIAGQALLQVGALASPASGAVTSVSTVNPIKVYFTVSEPQYLAWRKRFPTEESRSEADKNLKLQLILADGSIARGAAHDRGAARVGDRDRRPGRARERRQVGNGLGPRPRAGRRLGAGDRQPPAARPHGAAEGASRRQGARSCGDGARPVRARGQRRGARASGDRGTAGAREIDR